MSQTILANAVGVAFQQVQKYEKGANRISASRLQQFAKVLDVPIPYFFEGLTSPGDNSVANPVDDFLASSAGLQLVNAFSRIHDEELRRRIVKLVERLGID